MIAVKISREDMNARELRARAGRVKARAGRVKEGGVSRRLPTIDLVPESASRKVAAGSCGMDRQALRDRVHRCNAEGVEGLFNRGGGGARQLCGCLFGGGQPGFWLQAKEISWPMPNSLSRSRSMPEVRAGDGHCTGHVRPLPF